MTITYDELNPNHQEAHFTGTEQAAFYMPPVPGTDIGERWYVNLTGVVKFDFIGTGSSWLRELFKIYVKFDRSRLPNWDSSKWFAIRDYTIFVAPNSFTNLGPSQYAGWAVDEFGSIGNYKVDDKVEFWAKLCVRDSDGILHRISYNLTYIGDAVPPG